MGSPNSNGSSHKKHSYIGIQSAPIAPELARAMVTGIQSNFGRDACGYLAHHLGLMGSPAVPRLSQSVEPLILKLRHHLEFPLLNLSRGAVARQTSRRSPCL